MFNEEVLERITLDILYDLGYECINGYELKRKDFSKVILEEDLKEAIKKINGNIKEEQLHEAVRKIENLKHKNTILNNKEFTKYLIEGLQVSIYENGEKKYEKIKIMDYDNIYNNTFKVINQYTIIGNSEKRPDLIIFVNGLPLVVIELKTKIEEKTNLINSYNQLKSYQETLPRLFYYNQFMIITDGIRARAGTISSSWNNFSEWKKIEEDDKVTENMSTYKTLFYGMLRKDRLLDIISNYILWNDDNKILTSYHQYFAVKKAIKSTQDAIENKTGKAGIIWHTQGSGKNLSIIYYIENMIKKLENPNIIVLTDRIELGNQLYGILSKYSSYLKQELMKIKDMRDLNEKINKTKSGGIFLTTLQKFKKDTGIISNREGILIILDEVYRNQYATEEKIKLVEGKNKEIQYLQIAFPNATYIAFTGTPLEKKDKLPNNIFGKIIDTYDITQSVIDGATVPIVYESRVSKSGLTTKMLDKVDEYYNYVEKNENIEKYKIVDFQKNMYNISQVIENPNRLQMIVEDIIKQYEQIETSIANKAMVVAYSRSSAYKMYKKFLELRPNWKNKVHLIITSSKEDDEEMKQAIGTARDKKELEVEFKNPNSEFKIAIVVDMWLTGLDVPALGTMYIDKPMKKQGLMQVIARVNRVYKDKKAGLIVDYIGLERWILEALEIYNKRDQRKIINSTEIIKNLLEKIEQIRKIFKGFYYEHFIAATDNEKYEIIKAGANWILKTEQIREKFMEYSYNVKTLYSLCAGELSQKTKDEILFFISVRSFILKLMGRNIDVQEIDDSAAKMLEKAIKEDETLQILEKNNDNKLLIFNDEILNKITKIEKKNIAVEILIRSLKADIKQIGKENIAMMEKFSTKFQKILTLYSKRANSEDIEKIIEEIICLKKEIEEEIKNGNKYKLSFEEKAFFDALSDEPEVKKVIKDEVLIQIAKELVKTVDKNSSIDWDIRKDARTRMKIEIKKILIKYDYPVNKSEKAIQNVIRQAELNSRKIENKTEE